METKGSGGGGREGGQWGPQCIQGHSPDAWDSRGDAVDVRMLAVALTREALSKPEPHLCHRQSSKPGWARLILGQLLQTMGSAFHVRTRGWEQAGCLRIPPSCLPGMGAAEPAPTPVLSTAEGALEEAPCAAPDPQVGRRAPQSGSGGPGRRAPAPPGHYTGSSRGCCLQGPSGPVSEFSV